jgi:hypothetical protein
MQMQMQMQMRMQTPWHGSRGCRRRSSHQSRSTSVGQPAAQPAATIPWAAVLRSARRSERAYVDPRVATRGSQQQQAAIPADADFIESHATGACAYCWTDAEHAEVCVAFRGTNGVRDVLADIEAWPQHPVSDAGPERASRVHAGFLAQFRSVEAVLTRSVRARLPPPPAAVRLVVTGHSLGGGIGQLAAAHYAQLFAGLPAAHRPRVACHTFGAPRSGDAAFAAWFSSVVSENVRVANARDIVTMVPMGASWQHTLDRCVHLEDEDAADDPSRGGARVVSHDVPWLERHSAAMHRIDPDAPLREHSMRVYIRRLELAASRSPL